MSKSSKRRRSDLRKKEKARRKAEKKVAYLRYAEEGKRRERMTRKGGPSWLKGAHATSDCGNAGCTRCYPGRRPPQTRKGRVPHGTIAN